MTDQEINEAIARKCGWQKRLFKGFCSEDGCEFQEVRWFLNGTVTHQSPPNYCTDRNAMHEADPNGERALELCKLLGIKPWTSSVAITQAVLSATTRQHAEAFLRKFGLWKE